MRISKTKIKKTLTIKVIKYFFQFCLLLFLHTFYILYAKSNKKTVRVASLQMYSEMGETEQYLERISALARETSKKGANQKFNPNRTRGRNRSKASTGLYPVDRRCGSGALGL